MLAGGVVYGTLEIAFDVGRTWPTANEFRVASISAIFLISY